MTKTEMHVFRPDYASPPGETLRDRLAELNVTQAELAARASISSKHINQIMQGNAPITPETALILERITGTPASFWNRREADYRENLLRITPKTLSAEDEEWLRSLPIRELQKRNLITTANNRERLFDSVLTFFGVADHQAFQRIWRGPVASFRRSNAFSSHPGAVISWLRIAQLEAQSVKAEPFSAARFRKTLHHIRSLTAQGDPNELVKMCAEAGVVVVFVSEVQRCRISGAAWWTTPTRAVIALSDRYKRDDHFWFTFFHEAAHLLLHSKKETFVDDDSDDDLLEDEANRFARDILIPADRAADLRTLVTDADVKRFASDLGIAPGIVVGRLQHDGIWGYNRGHRLKRSIHIVES
jgi:HTH-type transcriptional regulator / antitoxin HigA